MGSYLNRRGWHRSAILLSGIVAALVLWARFEQTGINTPVEAADTIGLSAVFGLGAYCIVMGLRWTIAGFQDTTPETPGTSQELSAPLSQAHLGSIRGWFLVVVAFYWTKATMLLFSARDFAGVRPQTELTSGAVTVETLNFVILAVGLTAVVYRKQWARIGLGIALGLDWICTVTTIAIRQQLAHNPFDALVDSSGGSVRQAPGGFLFPTILTAVTLVYWFKSRRVKARFLNLPPT